MGVGRFELGTHERRKTQHHIGLVLVVIGQIVGEVIEVDFGAVQRERVRARFVVARALDARPDRVPVERCGEGERQRDGRKEANQHAKHGASLRTTALTTRLSLGRTEQDAHGDFRPC